MMDLCDYRDACERGDVSGDVNPAYLAQSAFRLAQSAAWRHVEGYEWAREWERDCRAAVAELGRACEAAAIRRYMRTGRVSGGGR